MVADEPQSPAANSDRRRPLGDDAAGLGVPRAACTAPAFACTWRATAQRRSQLPPPPQLSVNNRDVGGLKPARRATVTNDRDDNDDSTFTWRRRQRQQQRL
ncbi:hypothetical protein ACCO45_010890 [Purpureocillium lilacinum]|uniref:Uncharacterized protein n=1 Tax=Purpureocillium lilacinum TaxID=33203 RepID=A0ACC4DG38_PURLI